MYIKDILYAEQRSGHHIVFSCAKRKKPNKMEWTHEIFHSRQCVPILP